MIIKIRRLSKCSTGTLVKMGDDHWYWLTAIKPDNQYQLLRETSLTNSQQRFMQVNGDTFVCTAANTSAVRALRTFFRDQ